MDQVGTVESWLGKLRGRYPKVRAFAWAVFAIQAVAAVIQWGGHMIDAYGHAQFYFDNRQAIEHAVQSTIAAVFSPTGSIITMIVCGAFLYLDNRAQKHHPILTPQNLSSDTVRSPPVSASMSPPENETSITQHVQKSIDAIFWPMDGISVSRRTNLYQCDPSRPDEHIQNAH